MTWNHQPLTVYHGCDDASAASIARYGVSLGACRPGSDFGQGFYVTTNERQAMDWANARYRLRMRRGATSAAVLSFGIHRHSVGRLAAMAFVRDGAGSDYWALVDHCRNGGDHQHPNRANGFYDVVAGPVSLYRRRVVMRDSDQISFHTGAAISVLGRPTVRKPSPGPMF